MSEYVNDTIAAVSTALGEAAISVIRMTGPRALEIVDELTQLGKPLGELAPRQARLAKILDPHDGQVLDHALLLHFLAPASYTGEAMVELHCHGGVLVTQRVLQAVLAQGARAAEAGEFTQRAFLNGKMDLTQAEAVMDLIHAQSTLALRAANEQLDGTIGKEAQTMRDELIHIVAHVEAYIDFPEEDISPDVGEALLARLDALLHRAAQLLSTAEHGRILRHGARTVLCGLPNAGKSSLLNALLGYERAIVSATAGTTRDTIEEMLQVHGVPLRLVDTAGLRQSSDEIEQHGIARTEREVERADLVIEVVDATLPKPASTRVTVPATAAHLLILNKADLGIHADWQGSTGYAVSSLTGAGLEVLRAAVQERVLGNAMALTDHPIAINARHQSCFERVRHALAAARQSLLDKNPPELTAFELHEGMAALGDVTGRVDVEEVLDVVFSSFCIGK
jgi:tRNA modification GTPase